MSRSQWSGRVTGSSGSSSQPHKCLQNIRAVLYLGSTNSGAIRGIYAWCGQQGKHTACAAARVSLGSLSGGRESAAVHSPSRGTKVACSLTTKDVSCVTSRIIALEQKKGLILFKSGSTGRSKLLLVIRTAKKDQLAVQGIVLQIFII